MCLSQGHNTETTVWLEPATAQSQDKLSSTELLHLIVSKLMVYEPDLIWVHIVCNIGYLRT